MNFRNKRCFCGSGKKYKKCCQLKGLKYQEIFPAKTTGEKTEDVIELLSRKIFLKPWVFRKTYYKSDNKEFTDIAILFKDTIILIEAKGNQFDPKNPKRYLKNIKKAHKQLNNAERAIKNNEIVLFENEYYSFETNFEKINKIIKISVSDGVGEMEIAFHNKDIDFSKLEYAEMQKYTGFYNYDLNIHVFLLDELKFLSKHIDTIQDFLWYIEFEEKVFNNKFDVRDTQRVIALVDTHREDLISDFVRTYSWDEELQKTGILNINRLIEGQKDSDFITYFFTDSRKYIDKDVKYKKILEDNKKSYLWDSIVNILINDKDFYKKNHQAKEILEILSMPSRVFRTELSEKIIEVSKNGGGARMMFFECSDILYYYVEILENNILTEAKIEEWRNKFILKISCKLNHMEKFKEINGKVKKVFIIFKHKVKGKFSYNFMLINDINKFKSLKKLC